MASGPLRTCAGCRRRRPQAELIRVARRGDGDVRIDPLTVVGARLAGATGGRIEGRGAYVCRDEVCVRRSLESGSLRRALRCERALPTGLADELLDIAKGRDG